MKREPSPDQGEDEGRGCPAVKAVKLEHREPSAEKEPNSCPLKFVHITKCAGGAVEAWATSRGLYWGRRWRGVKEAIDKGVIPEQRGCMKSEPWHMPPKYFLENPYSSYECFVVVRDPYERAISEFRCPHKGFQSPVCTQKYRMMRRASATADELNSWLQRKLLSGAARPPYRNGHFIPQHFYLFSRDGKRFIPPENVLRFERLEDEFAELAQRYGLTPGPLERKNVSLVPRFTVEDLEAVTLRIIEEAYAEDFLLLGYERRCPAPQLQDKA